jgi:recombinational DNA repair protein RecR
MSSNFAKNVILQSLTTRVNKKKSKKKKTSNYIPLAVEEEEILAIKATVESNTTIKLEATIKSNMANVDNLPKLISFY